MMAKLANRAWMQFFMNATGTYSSLSAMILWNTWNEPGSHPNDIHPWNGQVTLGRIYERYRIINALTKFTFVPMVTASNATTAHNYRGDVYFYVLQWDSATNPVLASLITNEWAVVQSPSSIDLRSVMQIPGIKLKRRRWAEVPQSCTMTILNTMPQSTRISKNPGYASDVGDFAGTINTTTGVYTPPSTKLYTHFGCFIPTPQGITIGDDFPSYKVEMKDITLCNFSELKETAGAE